MSDYQLEEFLKATFGNNNSIWSPANHISLVSKEIETLKNEIASFLQNNDSDITSILLESQELCLESKSLHEELQRCKKKIENELAEIMNTIKSHDNITKELHSVEYALKIVSDVLRCGKFVREFDEGREKQSYSKAVEAVYNLLHFIENPTDGLQKLDIYNNTKHTAQFILDSLIHDLNSEWDRMVTWIVNVEKGETIITMTLTIDNSLAVIDVIDALHKCKRLSEKVISLGEFILKEFLIPILNKNVLVDVETDELMTVTIYEKNNSKPHYRGVISNLRQVFFYLSKKLNVEFCNGNTIMKMIGYNICDQFREFLVNDCLIHTVPHDMNDLQTYGKITSEIQEFQQFLHVIKFFPHEEYSLLEYVNNIDVIFAEKSSLHFLETARSIMMKDLSLMMSIGVESIPESSGTKNNNSEDEEEAIRNLDKTISRSLFYFPRCMVSKTAQELLDLVYVIMEQAVQCSDVVCKRFYNTCRLIFELYDGVVPYHHENYLQTIPQYVALFHNNCMYLAHNLQTFGDKWLILMEGRELDYPISFIDLTQKLRDLGHKHLSVHMQQQRKQILDNLRSSDLNCIVVKDTLGDNAEVAIRQCLRQLQLLKNVWIGVFPSNVFIRLMATLVNMFIDELIHRVCTAEDISMEMATQLTDMYTLVVQKVPQLFQDTSQVELHVKSWIKLQQLIFILKGSLNDIDNQWADGKGPLAAHFKTVELRSLIKALFQNTQFRANLLSKLR